MARPSPCDFMFGTTLGEGAYARVVHGQKKSTGEEYAIKIMEKRFIKREDKVKFVMMEKQVFSRVSHPHIVKLYYTFQDDNYLYMVMELCTGGELLNVITTLRDRNIQKGRENIACSMEITRFCIAQVIVAIEYLHTNAVIHRDLKPENILLTDKGQLKITDFGTAKDESASDNKTNTFCGTAEYVSPEVLRDKDASRGCDLWAVGCMVFQMLVGRPMFRAENEYLTFQEILNHNPEEYTFPSHFPQVAQELCTRLLQQNPNDRLGAGTNADGNGYVALKAHPFFDGIDWDHIDDIPPPYIPSINQLPPAESDGAFDDWLFAGEATELQVLVQSPRHIINNQAGNNVLVEETETPPSPEGSLWNQFLRDDERIVYTGLISKRKGLFSKKRQLILTTKPRLIYVDPIRMKQKGEIPWSENIYIQLKNSTTFDIVTPNRVYHITDSINGSQRWADSLNQALFSA